MEMPMFHDSCDDRHTATQRGSGNRPNRMTRSWTANGVHYTVDTTSFSSPGFSVGSMSGRADLPFRSAMRPSRSASEGLLGGAVGLLEEMLYRQQAHGNDASAKHPEWISSDSRRSTIDEANNTDEGLIYDHYEDDRSRASQAMKTDISRSLFSRIKDRILDAKQGTQQTNDRSYSPSPSREHSKDRSPTRRIRTERRYGSYRSEPRKPDWAERRRSQPQSVEIDYDDVAEDDGLISRGDRARGTSQPSHTMVEALTEAANFERRAVRHCKKRLANALRQPETDSHYLQQLLNDLRSHEEALAGAQASVDEARAGRRRNKPFRKTSYQTRDTEYMLPPELTRPVEDDFIDPFAGFGAGFFPTSRSRRSDPIFQAFQVFDSFGPFARASFGLYEPMFEQMRRSVNHPQFSLYTSTGGVAESPRNTQRTKNTRSSVPDPGPRPGPGFSTFTAIPRSREPPPNLLIPAEANALFQSYNQQWNAMSTTDKNIPFPARGLQANSLAARDTVWAPFCRADVATWSEELVMQANAQAFYLGVVGLTPVYKEALGTGSIEMGFDKSKASEYQLSELISILKKEKTRWHSDRLGRRHGGSGVPNEALQKDERARAVFHAVCGLMETAQ